MATKKATVQQTTELARYEPAPAHLRWMSVGVIDSPQQYADVGATYAFCVQTLEALDADRKELTRPLDQSKKAIIAKYKPLQEVYEKLKGRVTALLSQYDEAARARETARLERQAAQADKRGEKQFALDLRRGLSTVDGAPSTEFVAMANVWKGEVKDLKALLQAIIDDKAPAELIQVNDSEVNRLAKQYNEDLDARIPGLHAFVERQPRRK